MSDISRQTLSFESRFFLVRIFVVGILEDSHRPFLVDVGRSDGESDRIHGDVHEKDDQAANGGSASVWYERGKGYAQLDGGSDEGKREDSESSSTNREGLEESVDDSRPQRPNRLELLVADVENEERSPGERTRVKGIVRSIEEETKKWTNLSRTRTKRRYQVCRLGKR